MKRQPQKKNNQPPMTDDSPFRPPTRFGGFFILYAICYTFGTIPVYSLKDRRVPYGKKKGGAYAKQDEHVYSRRTANES